MRYLTALALALFVVVSLSSSHFSQGGQMEASMVLPVAEFLFPVGPERSTPKK